MKYTGYDYGRHQCLMLPSLKNWQFLECPFLQNWTFLQKSSFLEKLGQIAIVHTLNLDGYCEGETRARTFEGNRLMLRCQKQLRQEGMIRVERAERSVTTGLGCDSGVVNGSRD